MSTSNIDEIFEYNAAVREELRSVVAGISGEYEFAVPEGEQTWSAAQILEHLALTEEGMGKICSMLLRASKAPEGQPAKFSEGFLDRAGELDKIKVKTPPTGEPTGAVSLVESLQKMDMNRAKLETKRHRFTENDPCSATFPHPYLGDMTALEWLALIGLHEKRHLRQLKNLLARL